MKHVIGCTSKRPTRRAAKHLSKLCQWLWMLVLECAVWKGTSAAVWYCDWALLDSSIALQLFYYHNLTGISSVDSLLSVISTVVLQCSLVCSYYHLSSYLSSGISEPDTGSSCYIASILTLFDNASLRKSKRPGGKQQDRKRCSTRQRHECWR